MAYDQRRQQLYVGLRRTNRVARLGIAGDGALTRLDELSLASDPCHLALDHSGRFLFSAYYAYGAVAVHALGPGGELRPEGTTTYRLPVHAHCCVTSPDDRYLLVPHTMPANGISVFGFDSGSGRLQQERFLSAPPGRGPRHGLFRASANQLYLSCENSSEVAVYEYVPETGALKETQVVSTLPPSFASDNAVAQIHIDPAGTSVYVSNRGHDSIACYAVDPSTGRLHLRGHCHTEPAPRAFCPGPRGCLYVASLETGRITTFGTGTLERVNDVTVAGRRPMWLCCVSL